jgi:hypothetical protein
MATTRWEDRPFISDDRLHRRRVVTDSADLTSTRNQPSSGNPSDERMALKALVEKPSDADLLREMIGFAAQRLMELEVEGLTGAPYGEKTPERLAQRNG